MLGTALLLKQDNACRTCSAEARSSSTSKTRNFFSIFPLILDAKIPIFTPECSVIQAYMAIKHNRPRFQETNIPKILKFLPTTTMNTPQVCSSIFNPILRNRSNIRSDEHDLMLNNNKIKRFSATHIRKIQLLTQHSQHTRMHKPTFVTKFILE